MNKERLLTIWGSRKQIFEGVKNSIFKKEDVEEIAKDRLEICRSDKCGYLDTYGQSEAAVIKGAESCASCGCKLSWKTRALSDHCPGGFWKEIMTQTEEAALKDKLGISDDE